MAGCFVHLTSEKDRGHIFYVYLYAVVFRNASVSANTGIDTTFCGAPATGPICFPAVFFK
ncbi:hypothetical protein A4H97_25975 [Niastella yeongjuensis]|uniref:Uncharacterized protein n=1 Tax=Niastella yeongjuensis TaxID=354355 RepID=A0A1V9F1B1_9BACT|nr:hypothetical protein A4H97_25975 [Niastella yeongjuensis]